MGVTAGAYILTLFAVSFHWCPLPLSLSLMTLIYLTDFSNSWQQMKYRQRVLGLILVSPLCKEPSWSEWLYNKVPFLCRNIMSRKKSCYFLLKNFWYLQVMSNLLYFYGMCGVVKEILLKRYFSKVYLHPKTFLVLFSVLGRVIYFYLWW